MPEDLQKISNVVTENVAALLLNTQEIWQHTKQTTVGTNSPAW